MKKIFFFLLFTVSLTAIAQVQIPQEYSIQKPLQLQTVNAGSKSDSILVRGADKNVKYIPQSQFGTGASQDLQQTLITGGTVTSEDLGIEFDVNGTYAYYGSSSNYFKRTFESSVASASLGVGYGIDEDDNVTVKGTLALGYSENGSSEKVSRLYGNPLSINTTEFFLPYGDGTPKTLAAKGDITLQSTLTNGSVVTDSDLSIEFDANNSYAYYGRGLSNYRLNAEGTEATAAIGMASSADENELQQVYGEVSLGYARDGAYNITSRLQPNPNTSADTNFILPQGDGTTKKLLGTDDIFTTDNTVTSPLNTMTLNTNYPSAYRVQCPNITTGGIIYEKTSSGWIQYSVTTVEP